MAIRKKAATAGTPAPTSGEKGKQAFKVEVVHVKTYVCPNGDAYYSGRPYTVTAEKRAELFKYMDSNGIPYFRDYDPARYKKPVKDGPTNLHTEEKEAGQAADASGEIDTAEGRPEGVVRLPKSMRRTDKGVTV